MVFVMQRFDRVPNLLFEKGANVSSFRIGPSVVKEKRVYEQGLVFTSQRLTTCS